MQIEHINPNMLPKPRGYSHAVSVSGVRKTVYIGGQNALDQNGTIVGEGSLQKQTEQILSNIEKILSDANGSFGDIVKFTVYLLQGQNPIDGFQAFQQRWGGVQGLPVVTVIFVAGLGKPEWLVEIEAIAEI